MDEQNIKETTGEVKGQLVEEVDEESLTGEELEKRKTSQGFAIASWICLGMSLSGLFICGKIAEDFAFYVDAVIFHIGLALMICARIIDPKNKNAKILMIVYIGIYIATVVLIVVAILLVIWMINSCINECGNCSGMP